MTVAPTTLYNAEGELYADVALVTQGTATIARAWNTSNANDNHQLRLVSGDLVGKHATSAGTNTDATATLTLDTATRYQARLRWQVVGLRDGTSSEWTSVRGEQGATVDTATGRTATWTPSATALTRVDVGHDGVPMWRRARSRGSGCGRASRGCDVGVSARAAHRRGMRKVTECYTAAGEPQVPDANGLFTLVNDTTYYFRLAGVADRSGLSVQLTYGATLTATVTSEGSNKDGSRATPYRDERWAATARGAQPGSQRGIGDRSPRGLDGCAHAPTKVVVGATGGRTLGLDEHGKVRSLRWALVQPRRLRRPPRRLDRRDRHRHRRVTRRPAHRRHDRHALR